LAGLRESACPPGHLHNLIPGAAVARPARRRRAQRARAKTAVIDAGIIGDSDIRRITDPTMRHRVHCLLTENRSLNSTVSLLRDAHKEITIKVRPEELRPGGEDLVLSPDEVEAVKNFLDRRQMRTKHLERTAEDGVKHKDGRRVADPGFMTALEKIVKSYERL
jgi:hypothetical protein